MRSKNRMWLTAFCSLASSSLLLTPAKADGKGHNAQVPTFGSSPIKSLPSEVVAESPIKSTGAARAENDGAVISRPARPTTWRLR
jgi:hypothetical protein